MATVFLGFGETGLLILSLLVSSRSRLDECMLVILNFGYYCC